MAMAMAMVCSLNPATRDPEMTNNTFTVEGIITVGSCEHEVTLRFVKGNKGTDLCVFFYTGGKNIYSLWFSLEVGCLVHFNGAKKSDYRCQEMCDCV